MTVAHSKRVRTWACLAKCSVEDYMGAPPASTPLNQWCWMVASEPQQGPGAAMGLTSRCVRGSTCGAVGEISPDRNVCAQHAPESVPGDKKYPKKMRRRRLSCRRRTRALEAGLKDSGGQLHNVTGRRSGCHNNRLLLWRR